MKMAWIKNEGVQPNLDQKTYVNVKYRNGHVVNSIRIGFFDFLIFNKEDDIIEYEIVDTQSQDKKSNDQKE